MIPKKKKVKKGRIYQKKHHFSFFQIFFSFFILVITAFLVVSNWRLWQRRVLLQKREEILGREIAILEEKNQELKAKISETLDTDFLEKEARERFNLKKPGEEVVAVLPPENPGEKKQEEPQNFWQKLFNKLGIFSIIKN